jgi:imidazolonepropionase-like amidohydrolase
MFYSIVLILGLTAGPLPAPATTSARDTTSFRLYKFQQPIGIETSISARRPDGVTEIRTNFSFTDRQTSVPLASILTLGKDGSPLRFQVWGSTSRTTKVDDLVTVQGRSVEIDQSGQKRTVPAPPLFFVASGYAPVAVTEQLWIYWSNRARPAVVSLFPSGRVEFELRGTDEIVDDEGKRQKLERYAVSGLGWGRETIWIDGNRRLVAVKAVDAEFDHFEATRFGYSEALPTLVTSAAADGMTALAEISHAQLSAPKDSTPVAYVGGTLIDGTGAPPVRDAVVLVDRGRIAAAGPRAKVTVPTEARQIDVAGDTILPGLWDMHAHFEQVEWGPLYLAAGVTTVRDCGNELEFIRSARDTIEAGRGLGPRIMLACIVDGEGSASIGTDRLRDVGEIPDLIKKFQGAGCVQVKIYSSLNPRLLAPLALAAHEGGMSVTGHVPRGIGAVHAVEAGMDQINHLGFVVRALLPQAYDPDKPLPFPAFLRAVGEIELASAPARKTLEFFARRQVVIDPTLALSELGTHTHDEIVRVEPGLAKVAEPLRPAFESMGVSSDEVENSHKLWNVNLAVLRALREAGVPIVTGTDQAVPGHSLHRELEIYVSAGFTPMQAIQSATIIPARVLRRENDLGTIEPGKRADLIIVDSDPLTDIRNLRKIVTVVTGGRAYDAASLWKMVGFVP